MPGPTSWAARRPDRRRRAHLPGPLASDVRPRARAGADAVGLRLPLDGHALGHQPARRRAGARLEPRADGLGLHVPAVPSAHARGAAGHPAVEPVHHGRAALPGQLAVGRVLAVQRAGLRAAVLGLAGVGWRRCSCSWRRSARSCWRGRFGMRFRGALLCGIVFGFSLWSVSWVSWTTMSVWACLPWLCLLSELCLRRPGPLPFAGLATRRGRAVPRRATRRRASR